MADFLDFLDPVAADAYRRAALGRQEAQDPTNPGTGLSPEEETSTLSRALDAGLGGLGLLGKIADKTFGTRALRGGLNMLAGGDTDPYELLSFVPFSDTLGITNEKNVAQGTDVLGNLGLITKGDDSWENQLAGFGTELALDPTTYTGIGALTKAGEAASKAGTLAKNTSGRIAAGQASLFDVGLPFQKALFGADRIPLGTGPASEYVARNFLGAPIQAADYAARGVEKYVGTPISKLTGVNPVTALGNLGDAVYRQGRRLFDTSAGEAAGKIGQRLAESEFLPRLKAGQAQAEANFASGLSGLDDFAKKIPVDKRLDFNAALVQNAEGYRPAAESKLTALGFSQQEAADILSIGDRVANQTRATLGSERAIGLASKEASDFPTWATDANRAALTAGVPEPFPLTAFPTDYFPRTALNPEGGIGMGLPQNLSGIGQFQDARTDIFKGIPGGTMAIEGIVRDPALSGMARTTGPLGVQDQLLKTLTGHGLGPTPPAWQGTVWGDSAWEGAKKQAKQLADYLEQIPDKTMKEGLFNLDFMGLSRARQMDSARVLASGETVMKGLTQQAQPLATLRQAGISAVPVEDALTKAGLTDASTGSPLAKMNLAQALGVHPNDLRNMAVPEDVAKDMFRIGQMWRTPDAVKPVVEMLDRMQNLFKGGVTSPFPAFQMRNLATGIVNMARADVLSLQAGKDMLNVLRGGSLSDETVAKLFPGLGSAEGTKKFRELLVGNNVAFTRSGQTGERIGGIEPVSRAGLLPGDLPDVGGSVRPVMGDVQQFLSGYIPEKGKVMQQLNPFESLARETGVGPRSHFTPIRQGEKLGNTSEDWIRGTHFLGGMLHDMSPAEAKLSTMKYQIAYDDLTQFEKNVMRRVFPWYSFCVPEEYEILTKAGWKLHWQLAIGEEVLSLNHETGEMAWDKVEEINVFDHDGEMAVFESRGAKWLCTSNHNWPTVTVKTLSKGKQYGGQKALTPTYKLSAYHKIPKTGDFRGGESILSPRLAAILGWVVTDGTFRWRGNHCEMVVYQSEKKFIGEVETALGRARRAGADRRTNRTTGANNTAPVHTVPVRLEDTRKIVEYFRTKADLPRIVGGLSREAAEAMYDAMMMAEGSMTATGQKSFGQSVKNKAVRDAFQMLCYLTGRSANLVPSGCYIPSTKFMQVKDWLCGTERYVGKVWCPTTGNGTWVMRHKGKACITGNSRRNLPPIIEDLVTNPGKITAGVRLTSGVRDPSQFVPSYIGEGAGIPVPGAPDGQQRYISSFGLPIEDEGLKTIGSFLKGDFRRTLQQGIGMANPLVKLPFEQAFGTQLFSGRKLDELKPSVTMSLGGLVPDQTARGLTELAANSPLSRVVGSVDDIFDKRKTIGATLVNLGTGVKLTDVDMEKQQDIAARQLAQKMLTGTPGIRTREEVYAPLAERGNLNPDQRFMLEMMKSTDKRIQDRAALERANQPLR